MAEGLSFEEVRQSDRVACWEQSGEDMIYLPGGRILWRERRLDSWDDALSAVEWRVRPAGSSGPPEGWYFPGEAGA